MSSRECTDLRPLVGRAPRQLAVLIVAEEDNRLEPLVARLREEGYQADQVHSGAAALERVSGEMVDLVLLDTALPDMDGFDVLRQLRHRGSELELPVIMIVGREKGVDHETKAFDQGANDCISKLQTRPIVARIRSHLKRLASERAVFEREQRYAFAALGANDALWNWNLETDVVFYSPGWNAIMGFSNGELMASPDLWMQCIHSEDRSRVTIEIESYLHGSSRDHFDCEMRLRTREGTYRWMLCRGMKIRDDHGQAKHFVGSMTDVTRSKVADPLTGLPNRVQFDERLYRCIEQQRRDAERRFAVLYLDIDNFNRINDGLGHDVGDQMLVAIARRLENCVRMCDAVLARIGGDEFAILLEYLTTDVTIDAVGCRIIEAVKAPFAIGGGREVFTSASIGVSISSQRSDTVADMIREADTAMYQAKARGKSCYQVFDPHLKERVSARLSLEMMLRHALEQNEFLLNYQPIVNIDSGDMVGMEALIRWDNPDMGLIPPSDFIPMAEETGLIVPIGMWVLKTACEQMVAWQRQYPHCRDVFLGFNVSAVQFRSALAAEVTEVLCQTGIRARDLKLEVTESTVMENTDEATLVLEELRRSGITVAIDDFGTGYSSLAYLHRLPLDCLKVDQSFVAKMASTNENRMIVETIVTLASSLGLDIIAEGIETELQRHMLSEIGCRHGQGYLFSKPLSPSQMSEMIAAQTSFAPESQSDVLVGSH